MDATIGYGLWSLVIVNSNAGFHSTAARTP
jgi:hypothetical protein